MRLISTILLAVLLFSLVFCCVPFAFADGEPTEPAVDYSDYDWENISFQGMDYRTWMAMSEWLKENADIELVLVVARRSDGEASTDLAGMMYDHFIADPERVMYAMLSEEDIYEGPLHYLSIVSEADDWNDMIHALQTVKLSGPYAEKGYMRLAEMIEYAEQTYRAEIHNPNLEAYIWENYDWENFSIIGLDDSTWSAMCDWFRNDGDLHTIFFAAQRTDGFYATDISCIMSQRFMADPETFLYALAKEEEQTWKLCSNLLLFETYEWDAMVEVLETVELSGPDAEKGYDILTFMIDYAEQEYNREIHNPKTGDSIGVFVALLVVSGLSGAVLLTQRKRFIA